VGEHVVNLPGDPGALIQRCHLGLLLAELIRLASGCVSRLLYVLLYEPYVQASDQVGQTRYVMYSSNFWWRSWYLRSFR
jgi:hypothetical protein